jgi:very-short-patch-repair endonuclease
VDDRIDALARGQNGVVTRAQLLRLGIPPGAIRRRARAGRLRRAHRGVYVVGPIPPAWSRETAAVLACGPEAALSHRSAASLWELVRPPAADAPVDVIVPAGENGPRAGIRVRRVVALEPDERTSLHHIPITAPGRTVLDLASVADPREVEHAVACAEREGLADRSHWTRLLERYRGRKGVALLRAVLERHGGPAFTRSEAEVRFLGLLRKARFPAPEVNVRVAGFELDFFWRAERIAVEVDGYRFHGSRSRFERDRRRSAQLAAQGIQVIPLTWKQIVEDEVATAVQLGQALMNARSRGG